MSKVLPPIEAPDVSPAEFQRSKVEQDGTLVVPSFRMPFSGYASAEAREALVRRRAIFDIAIDAAKYDIATYRQIMDDKLHLPLVARQSEIYDVGWRAETIGGVYTEAFTPRRSGLVQDKKRVLINLHGGGFVVGARTVGRVESIPIAHSAGIKVISVDYRMAPENKFPAGSEDVAAVYKELLRQYVPKNIGIYGCSAGGLLTAQAVAWFQKENLPMPGAIGIFAASTHGFTEGDSGQLAWRLGEEAGEPPLGLAPKLYGPYFEGASASDPLVAPHLSTSVLAQFPPTLLVTGSRSFDASGAFRSQIELTLAGVEAKLSVWDGLMHAFFLDPDLAESREAYQVIASFFNCHLGRVSV